MLPTYPASVSNVLFIPEQTTVFDALMLPEIEIGLTVIITLGVFTGEHAPLVIIVL